MDKNIGRALEIVKDLLLIVEVNIRDHNRPDNYFLGKIKELTKIINDNKE